MQPYFVHILASSEGTRKRDPQGRTSFSIWLNPIHIHAKTVKKPCTSHMIKGHDSFIDWVGENWKKFLSSAKELVEPCKSDINTKINNSHAKLTLMCKNSNCKFNPKFNYIQLDFNDFFLSDQEVRPLNPTTLCFEAIDLTELDFLLPVCFFPTEDAFLEVLAPDDFFDLET